MSGTQAERGQPNHVILMKMSNLHRTTKAEKDTDPENDDSDDDEDDDEKTPELETALLKHTGCVNRIRVNIYKYTQYKFISIIAM